jgi:predicted  nucleic acid-binding Zn-ribbon protein
MSACGGSMEPIGSFQRRKGEYVLVHCCLDCGLERFNRIAADDDFDLVLALPSLPPLTSGEVKAQRLEEELSEESDEHQVA